MIPVAIPNISSFGRVIKKWDMITARGTTLFIPSDDAIYMDVDLDNSIDSFIRDFLDLGNDLFNIYKDVYDPLYYSNLKRQQKSLENRITWSDMTVEKFLNDDASIYQKIGSEEINQKVLLFISKYGFSTPRDNSRELVISAQRCWETWLLEDLNITRRSFRIIGCTFLIYDLLTDFVAFCKPEYERERTLALYDEEIYRQLGCQVNFSLDQRYDSENKKFITEYTVFSMIEYLEMLLAIINSDGLQQKFSVCPNCEKTFLYKNPKTIYCSATCRNRANVKKNYYRKGKIVNQGDTEGRHKTD